MLKKRGKSTPKYYRQVTFFGRLKLISELISRDVFAIEELGPKGGNLIFSVPALTDLVKDMRFVRFAGLGIKVRRGPLLIS